MIRDLVITLEEYGFQYGKTLKNNPNDSTVFKNHSNVQLHVKYIKQGDALSQEEKQFQFPDASFKLSPNALPSKHGAVVVVMWYKTIHSFLTTFHNDLNGKLNSKIITASVRPKPTTESFEEPVRISWRIKELVIQDYFVFN